jgi:hypothetical protein
MTFYLSITSKVYQMEITLFTSFLYEEEWLLGDCLYSLVTQKIIDIV